MSTIAKTVVTDSVVTNSDTSTTATPPLPTTTTTNTTTTTTNTTTTSTTATINTPAPNLTVNKKFVIINPIHTSSSTSLNAPSTLTPSAATKNITTTTVLNQQPVKIINISQLNNVIRPTAAPNQIRTQILSPILNKPQIVMINTNNLLQSKVITANPVVTFQSTQPSVVQSQTSSTITNTNMLNSSIKASSMNINTENSLSSGGPSTTASSTLSSASSSSLVSNASSTLVLNGQQHITPATASS